MLKFILEVSRSVVTDELEEMRLGMLKRGSENHSGKKGHEMARARHA